MAEVVRRIGWFERIGGAFKGILIGVVLFFGSFVLLGWNELNTVRNYRTVSAGRGAVVPADSAAVDAAKEGKLVHLTGKATTREMLRDSVFDVQENALKLTRKVEMYQWRERSSTRTEKKLGGSEVETTSYSYEKVWSGSLIESSRFEGPEPDRSRHVNPAGMPFSSDERVAREAKLGAYALPHTLVEEMSVKVPVQVRAGMAPDSVRPRTREIPGGLYIGANPDSPQIGDLRVTFSQTPPGEVSVLARQAAGSLAAFTVEKTGKKIFRLMDGVHGAAEMFDVLKKEASMWAWILRLVGFLLMCGGLNAVFRPLSVLADVVPLFGRIVGFGTGLIAGIVSLTLTLITIAICWFAVRPMLSIPLLVVAIGLPLLLRKKKPADAGPAPAA